MYYNVERNSEILPENTSAPISAKLLIKIRMYPIPEANHRLVVIPTNLSRQ